MIQHENLHWALRIDLKTQQHEQANQIIEKTQAEQRQVRQGKAKPSKTRQSRNKSRNEIRQIDQSVNR